MKVGKCTGVTLWKWGRRVELWWCLGSVEEHRHPGQEVEVLVLAGRARFMRRDSVLNPAECVDIERGTRWHWFTVPTGWWHAFQLKSWCLVFVNWTTGESPAANLTWRR